MNDNVKVILRGCITNYYYLLESAEKYDRTAGEIESNLAASASTGYACTMYDKTAPEMMAEVVTLRGHAEQCRCAAKRISDVLHISDLSDRDQVVLKAVYKNETYEDAGDVVGYTAVQIYRIMTSIYNRMRPYVDELRR